MIVIMMVVVLGDNGSNDDNLRDGYESTVIDVEIVIVMQRGTGNDNPRFVVSLQAEDLKVHNLGNYNCMYLYLGIKKKIVYVALNANVKYELTTPFNCYSPFVNIKDI